MYKKFWLPYLWKELKKERNNIRAFAWDYSINQSKLHDICLKLKCDGLKNDNMLEISEYIDIINKKINELIKR